MAYISYNKLWESEFDDIVSKRDKLQDLNINQLNSKYTIPIKKMKKFQQILKQLMMKML